MSDLDKDRIRAIIILVVMLLVIIVMGYGLSLYWVFMPLGVRLVLESAGFFLGFLALFCIIVVVMVIFVGLVMELISQWLTARNQ